MQEDNWEFGRHVFRETRNTTRQRRVPPKTHPRSTSTLGSSDPPRIAVRARCTLIPPLVQRLQQYVSGQQPKNSRLAQTNTNENPYPPSPKVLAAVRAAVDGRLRLYPNPTASALRDKLAKLHG